jgi:TPR repeat protein
VDKETTVTDMSTSNGKDTARDTTGDPPKAPTENNDGGEQKTMSTTKDGAQNDLDLECCICLENLPKDDLKFLRWTCCGQGMHKHCTTDLYSMNMAGSCPLCRAKTPTSEEEHVKYLRPWVKKKKAWAQSMLGQMYRNGKGVTQSYEMAIRLSEQAAQQGDANAMSNLGVMHERGLGVEQSYEKAKEYYEQAAHLGYAHAQFSLGLMCERGTGVTQSYEKAKELYEPAVEQGYAKAMVDLACLYYNGQGVEQSYEAAAALYEQAAQQGYTFAMNNLGLLYAKGQGVQRDIFKARELFTTAEALGNADASRSLKHLDDHERQVSALDPNAIVCSFCGLPQTATRNFDKFKCPCKSTRYCNTTCQKKHWKMHRNNCKRLRAELKQKKMDQVAKAKEEHSDNPLLQMKDEEENDDDDGKEKTTTRQEKEKEKQEE